MYEMRENAATIFITPFYFATMRFVFESLGKYWLLFRHESFSDFPGISANLDQF